MHDNVNMTVIRDDKVVVCELEYAGHVAVGHAICHEEDDFVPQVGIPLATGRAFADLGRRLKREANHLMKES